MADFLLEIYGEEIPALMQKPAAESLLRISKDVFEKNNMHFADDQLKVFVAPRRLAIHGFNLNQSLKTAEVRKFGPKVDANEKAIQGFLRSVGVDDVSKLKQEEKNGDLCYLYFQPESEVDTAKVIQESLPQILQKMTSFWPKQMRWDIEGDKNQPKWIRPIRNIACMFGSDVIPLKFAGLESNNLTFGHILSGDKALKIPNANDYREVLEDNFVIVDQEIRRNKILQQIRKIKTDLDLETVDHEESSLVEEVTGLCEFPTAFIANIEQRFMELPEEILILTLRSNQRYFCMRHKGKIAPQFIFISNSITQSKESQEKIVSDNEKLVRARLSDAEFFISEDLKLPLADRFENLKAVTFHKDLGSVHDKVNRIKSLAKFLSVFVPHCELSLIDKTAGLIKSDLTTKAVAEFPELQGKIGSFYASKQGEEEKLAAAIYEHYLPLGPNSELPKTPLGISMAIADKIDSIVGFYLANEKPTSSRDPYGLRRATLGIIRISVTYNIAFPIRILVDKSINSYPTKILKKMLLAQDDDFLKAKKKITEEIIQFFIERLRSYAKDNEIASTDIIKSVTEEYLSDLDKHKYCDIVYLLKKIDFLQKFISDEKNKKILQLYKRAANILEIEEKKDDERYEGRISVLKLEDKYEMVLQRAIKKVKGDYVKLVIKGDFDGAFALLHAIEAPLAKFFDHVIVNDQNKKLRENRLLLLSKIRWLFDQVADLSNIEI